MYIERMKNVELEYRVVGFFDILGFSSMVSEDSRLSEPKYLPIMLEVLESIEGDYKKGELDVQIFSDSIIVSAPLSPINIVNVIEAAAKLQRLFLQSEILLRGGIAFGKHYATSNVMFSQALISAYNIESKIARFPRIVIQDDTLNFAWHHQDANEELQVRIRDLVLMDRDRALFVNYLSAEALAVLTPKIKACIEANTRPVETILEKMRWLLDYQNYSSGMYGLERLDSNHFANSFAKMESIP